MLGAELGEEQAQEMVDLRDRGDGRLAAAARHALLDGHAGRQTLDGIHVGFFHLLDELSGVGRHAVEEAPLALGEEDVKGEVDFPDPLRPVTTTIFSRGMSTEMFLRLCSRAPARG